MRFSCSGGTVSWRAYVRALRFVARRNAARRLRARPLLGAVRARNLP
jgi:hypothetical protein